MIDPVEAAGYVRAAKSALDMIKAAKELIPKGKDKDAVAHKIEEAEQALKRADAKLAKELGYPLCECTFPPQIMLWKEKKRRFVCPNSACRSEKSRPATGPILVRPPRRSLRRVSSHEAD